MAVSNPAKISLTDFIKRELIRLHIFPSILGHRYLAYAIERVAIDPLRIDGIINGLYQEAASIYHTNEQAVERDVRTALDACWERGGRETLDKMAYSHLTQRPCAKEFISIVAAYISIAYRR